MSRSFNVEKLDSGYWMAIGKDDDGVRYRATGRSASDAVQLAENKMAEERRTKAVPEFPEIPAKLKEFEFTFKHRPSHTAESHQVEVMSMLGDEEHIVQVECQYIDWHRDFVMFYDYGEDGGKVVKLLVHKASFIYARKL